MKPGRFEILRGTPDPMILEALHVVGSLPGYRIAERIEGQREGAEANEGTVCTALLRLQQQGWIVSQRGAFANNPKARFYSITKRGLKQLAIETFNCEAISGLIGRTPNLKVAKQQ